MTNFLLLSISVGDLGDADENVEQLCWGTSASTIPGDEKIGLMVGAGAGTDESSIPTNTGGGKVEEEQEPLALLVVHAAMHMLFLPQFTCDFFETNGSNSPVHRNQGAQSKEDRDLKSEAGLRAKAVDAGISLVPRPSSIVWAPGTGGPSSSIGI